MSEVMIDSAPLREEVPKNHRKVATDPQGITTPTQGNFSPLISGMTAISSTPSLEPHSVEPSSFVRQTCTASSSSEQSDERTRINPSSDAALYRQGLVDRVLHRVSVFGRQKADLSKNQSVVERK